MSVKPECSIEGCDRGSLARGWCGKHYARWKRNGDPEYLHGDMREPGAPAASRREIRDAEVCFTANGDAFVENYSNSGKRRYGVVHTCETCGLETFSPCSGKKVFRFCSHECAGPAHRDNKLGKTMGGSKKHQIQKLDAMLSALVRHESSCEICGAVDMLQCAHGFSRRYRSVRWDRRNVFCLCARCHMFYTHRPIEWDEWLRQRWGDDLYQELRAHALQAKKADLEEMRRGLVDETIERGITRNQLPKSIRGWEGIRDVAA